MHKTDVNYSEVSILTALITPVWAFFMLENPLEED